MFLKKKSKGWRKCGGLNSRLFLTQVGLGYWQNHYLLLHCYLNSVYDLNCHTYWKVWKRIKRNCNANFPLNIWCQLKHDWAGFAMCWADSDPSSLPVRMWCSANFICSGYNQCFIIQEIKNKSFCTLKVWIRALDGSNLSVFWVLVKVNLISSIFVRLDFDKGELTLLAHVFFLVCNSI